MRRSSLTLLSLLPVLVASVSLAGCSSPDGPSGPTGTLTGTLQAVGGPAGGSPRALSGQVTARESNGARYSFSAGANGRFSIHVPVGTYTVSGQNPDYEGGTAKCQASGPVKVTKGATSSVAVDCQEK